MRWRRSVGYASIAVCSTAKDVNVPSSPTSASARSVLTPDVCSHSSAHDASSRPEAASSSVRRSCSVVLPYACLVK